MTLKQALVIQLLSMRSRFRSRLRVNSQRYYLRHKERISERTKKYYALNKGPNSRGKRRAASQRRRDSDLNFRLSITLANRMRCALRQSFISKSPGMRTIDLLGCTISELRQHLENRFIGGMTWENHGLHGWHIDHIRPCASFDLTQPAQQRECFHYLNLQPLWAKDNMSKSAKWGPVNDNEKKTE